MKEVTLSEALRNYINCGSMIIGGGINMFGEEYTMRSGTPDTHKRIKEYFDTKKGDASMFGEEYVNGIPITDNEKLDDFLKGKVQTHNISNEQALQYAKEKLGYIPSSIKAL